MATTKNLLINLLLISLAFTPTLILNGFCEPYQRGFYCDDESIRKPKLDHEKVTPVELAIILIIPSVLLISIVNWLSHNKYECKQQEHTAIKLTLNDIFLLFFGLGLTMIIVDTSKFAIGRHRPNFYKSCEPRIAKYDANNEKTLHECQTLGAETMYNYITEYECTAKNIEWPEDLHQSFMSGHSDTMMFAAVFISITIAHRLKTHLETTIARLIVGTIIVLHVDFALFVGYTRVSDYRHHPGDVLIGLIHGALMACFVKYFIDKTYLSRCLSKDASENGSRVSLKAQMKTIENPSIDLPEMV